MQLPPVAASVEVADVGLAHDGDDGLLIVILRFLSVTGGSSGDDGQESSDDELKEM